MCFHSHLGNPTVSRLALPLEPVIVYASEYAPLIWLYPTPLKWAQSEAPVAIPNSYQIGWPTKSAWAPTPEIIENDLRTSEHLSSFQSSISWRCWGARWVFRLFGWGPGGPLLCGLLGLPFVRRPAGMRLLWAGLNHESLFLLVVFWDYGGITNHRWRRRPCRRGGRADENLVVLTLFLLCR
jgi:hypothetical protein